MGCLSVIKTTEGSVWKTLVNTIKPEPWSVPCYGYHMRPNTWQSDWAHMLPQTITLTSVFDETQHRNTSHKLKCWSPKMTFKSLRGGKGPINHMSLCWPFLLIGFQVVTFKFLIKCGWGRMVTRWSQVQNESNDWRFILILHWDWSFIISWFHRKVTDKLKFNSPSMSAGRWFIIDPDSHASM